MNTYTTFKRLLTILASAALLTVSYTAQAAEPQSNFSIGFDTAETVIPIETLMTPCLTKTGELKAVREVAREASGVTEQDAITIATASRSESEPADRIDVDIHDGIVPVLVHELIELDGLPIMKLRDSDTRKVYFGISFDGVIGVHGKL